MTHNEYTNKYKSEIGILNRFLSHFFHGVRVESARQEFLRAYGCDELSDWVVTEDGRVV